MKLQPPRRRAKFVNTLGIERGTRITDMAISWRDFKRRFTGAALAAHSGIFWAESYIGGQLVHRWRLGRPADPVAAYVALMATAPASRAA